MRGYDVNLYTDVHVHVCVCMHSMCMCMCTRASPGHETIAQPCGRRRSAFRPAERPSGLASKMGSCRWSFSVA